MVGTNKVHVLVVDMKIQKNPETSKRGRASAPFFSKKMEDKAGFFGYQPGTGVLHEPNELIEKWRRKAEHAENEGRYKDATHHYLKLLHEISRSDRQNKHIEDLRLPFHHATTNFWKWVENGNRILSANKTQKLCRDLIKFADRLSEEEIRGELKIFLG